MFHNLLSNAIKYRDTSRPLDIFVSSEEKGNEWLFAIKDNGIGIASSEIGKIFKVREHQSNGNKEYRIGLAICKNIVERHGGKIWVESEPGKGASFYFSLKRY